MVRIPDALVALVEQGIVDEVVRPLKSGKEAQIYLVLAGGEERVAKVYKQAQQRSFQNRAEYQEGRKVRSSRDQRAMDKRSKYGRAQQEEAWKSAEVDMIYRLRDAGVRVPTPFHFIEGVLIMQAVVDAHGYPAPRLGEVTIDRAEAEKIYRQLLGEVVRMLCADVVHGDLSEFNVLLAADGPVVIDFPQAVNAARNQNARKLLLRDVANLHRFIARFDPNRRTLPYAEEMWQLYERGELTPQSVLSGSFRGSGRAADTRAVLQIVGDAQHDERKRRERRGIGMQGVPPERTHQPRAPQQKPRAPHARQPVALQQHPRPDPHPRPEHAPPKKTGRRRRRRR